MTDIKEAAQNYEPASTKNIAELPKVSVASEIVEKTFKEGTAEEFKVNVINVDGEDYRVPDSVLNNLKAILEEKPDLQSFKVKKEGTDLRTRYTVIPLS